MGTVARSIFRYGNGAVMSSADMRAAAVLRDRLAIGRPIASAEAMQDIMSDRGWSLDTLADVTNMNPQSCKNMLSLLRLDGSIQTVIDSGKLGMTVGYLLAMLGSHELQVETLKRLIAERGVKIRTVDAKAAVSRAKRSLQSTQVPAKRQRRGLAIQCLDKLAYKLSSWEQATLRAEVENDYSALWTLYERTGGKMGTDQWIMPRVITWRVASLRELFLVNAKNLDDAYERVME